MEYTEINKALETESRLVVGRGEGKGLKRSDYFNKYGVFFWSDGNVLELDRDAQHCECTRYH